MENPEEVLQWLEELSRRRSAAIPRILDEYLLWVARTGEIMFRWPLVRTLLKEKLMTVLNEYRETPPGLELPPCPNVPPFDCESMRACFLSRLDAFAGPPFTVQRICELLSYPRKHYTRIDKFMRAFEKNVLVVSTKEPEPFRRAALLDPDGSDANSDCNVDVEMEDAPVGTLNGPLEPPVTSPVAVASSSSPNDSPPHEDYTESHEPALSVSLEPDEPVQSHAEPENPPEPEETMETQPTVMDTTETIHTETPAAPIEPADIQPDIPIESEPEKAEIKPEYSKPIETDEKPDTEQTQSDLPSFESIPQKLEAYEAEIPKIESPVNNPPENYEAICSEIKNDEESLPEPQPEEPEPQPEPEILAQTEPEAPVEPETPKDSAVSEESIDEDV